MPTLQHSRPKPCERNAGRSLASRLAFQQVEDLIHCAAHVIAIIIIAIVAISMAMNQTLLVTKLLSVSGMQDEALHRRSHLSLGPRYLRKSRRSM